MGNFISYKNDADFENQGVKIRLKFTDTIKDIKTVIMQKLELSSDVFEMIEV